MIRIGPAGIGGFKEIGKVLEEYKKLGITCAEIPFTYQIWLNNSQAKEIEKINREFDIQLSIHAPYFINLNSNEKEKIEKSKKRILTCCERAHYLGAKYVVFHAGFYGKKSKEETFEVIKNEIIEMQEKIKKEGWNVKLAPETMGKVNVFGTIEEIFKLVKETKCSFCIDFAHLLAISNGKTVYDEMCKQLKDFSHIHSHFSGIEFGVKGEKRHKITEISEIKKLVEAIKKNKIDNITIINESPDSIGDSIKTIKIFKE